MRESIIFLFLFLCQVLQGQPIRKVLDKENNQPVPYASLKVLHQPRGTVSSSDGEFALDIQSLDTLLISSVGYEDLLIKGSEISNRILLTKQVKVLQPVEVGKRSGQVTLPGNTANLTRDIQWGPGFSFGDEFAQKINTPDSTMVYYIRRVIVPVDKFSCWGPLLIRVYEKDTTGMPGKMLFSNEFFDFDRKNKFAYLDLSSFNIYLDRVDFFFVSVSWPAIIKHTKCITTLVLSKGSSQQTYSRSLTNINYSWYPFGKFTDVMGKPFTASMFISIEVESY